MVSASKKNLWLHPAGKYSKSQKQSTWRCHHVNEGKSSFNEGTVTALGALHSKWSKKNLAAEKWWETHFLCNKEKEKCIQYYVDGETAVARKWVEDTETAIRQKQEYMINAEKAGLTTRNTKITFEDTLNAIGDSLRDHASSDNQEDGEVDEDDEEDRELV